jgi:hypothetical protein
MFHQVGHEMAQRIAEEQFRSKKVETVATLPEHMESFSSLWRGLQQRWLAGLTQAEKECFDGLNTETWMDAFRIIRSYRRLAGETGATDFAVAAHDLGNRLGISLSGACNIRKALVTKGVIEPTMPYQRLAHAARYRWTCNGGGQSSRGSLK